MAHLFDDASTEYLQIEQEIATLPFAFVCKFNTNDLAAYQTLFSSVDKDVDNNYHRILLLGSGDAAANKISVESNNPLGRAITTTTFSANTWHHICGIWVSTTDRRALLDGAGRIVDATSSTPAGLDRTCIGVLGRLSIVQYMSGMIAEAAIYDLSVYPGANDGQRADYFEARILPSLVKRFTPDNYPLGLAAYWPLIRGINDRVGGFNLTASGTVAATHPNIIQPCGVL